MLPTLIVIGAQKSGTTSLHHYLGLHPEISMSKEKELNFFVEERNWSKGLAWYESQFRGEATHFGESSPSYAAFPRYDGVPARMHSIVPKARLIYVVRDPVERIVSEYVHRYAAGLESRSVDEALGDFERDPYVDRSRYHFQLEQFLVYFPVSQILVISAEDLLHRRLETLQRTFRFLGVNDSFKSRGFGSVRHAATQKRRKSPIGQRLEALSESGPLRRARPGLRWHLGRTLSFPFSREVEPPQLSDQLKAELVELLRDDVDRLRGLAGQEFAEWCL